MRLPTQLTTKRFYLRPFDSIDAEAAFKTFGDPTVMQFISGGADANVDMTRARLLRYLEHQRAHGFSKWAVIDHATNAIVGDAGLMWMPDHSEVELGYRLAQPYWGKGCATEIGAAWLAFAFRFAQLSNVIAFAHPENEASLRVMKKLGMTVRGRACYFDMDVIVYSIRKGQLDV